MYSQKIQAVANKLSVLAGSVPEDHWKLLRACRAELLDAAEGVLNMERELCFPSSPEMQEVPA